MSTIQQQMQMYHALETALRGAADAKQPLTLQDIWEMPSIQSVAPKKTVIRDKLKVLIHHKMIHKVPVAESLSGNKMERVAYLWADPDKTTDNEVTFRRGSTLHQSKRENPPGAKSEQSEAQVWPVVDRRAQQLLQEGPTEQVQVEFNGMRVFAGRDVEMFIDHVKCIVDKNPETGLVRIKIE